MIKLINFEFHLYFGQTIEFHFGYHKVCRYIFVTIKTSIAALGIPQDLNSVYLVDLSGLS